MRKGHEKQEEAVEKKKDELSAYRFHWIASFNLKEI